MFKLTEEQVNYIIEVYGGSKRIIRDIECRLNLLAIPMDDDEYYEIVAAVAAQKETIRNKAKNYTTREDAMSVWVSTDKLILFALEEKYIDFSNLNPEVQERIRNFR